MMKKSQGDSGTFGSQKTMNKIQVAQSKNKGNQLFKQQLTGGRTTSKGLGTKGFDLNDARQTAGDPQSISLGGGALQGTGSDRKGKIMPAYKKGGMVKKTGPALVHKGERVLTSSQAKKMPLAKLQKALTKKGK